MSPRRRCVRHVPIKLGKNVFLYALFPYKLTEFHQNRPFFGPFSEHDASKRPLRGNFMISGAYKTGKTRRFIGPILKKWLLKEVGDGRDRRCPTKSGMTKVGSSDPGTVAGATIAGQGVSGQKSPLKMNGLLRLLLLRRLCVRRFDFLLEFEDG